MYVGESGRCAYDRGLEHNKALERDDEESPLVEHHQQEHQGLPKAFEMKIAHFTSKPLVRQSLEAHKIDLEQKDCQVLSRRRR